MDLNNVSIAGTLCKDPKRVHENIVKFNLMFDGDKKKDDKWPEANFIQVEVFNRGNWKQADFVMEKFKDKSAVVVTGELRQRTWTDQNGKRSEMVIVANNVFFPKRDRAGAEGNSAANAATPPPSSNSSYISEDVSWPV